jgi:hypothetical protein
VGFIVMFVSQGKLYSFDLKIAIEGMCGGH